MNRTAAVEIEELKTVMFHVPKKKSIFLLFPGHWFRAKNQLAPEKNGTARNSKQLLVNSSFINT
jgi:hypothetical protein